jgi:hypothetical protein
VKTRVGICRTAVIVVAACPWALEPHGSTQKFNHYSILRGAGNG